MSRSKYQMTDAAAKRIRDRLLVKWQEKPYIGIETIEQLLREEQFATGWRYSYVSDLVQWLIENTNGSFANDIAKAYIREYYELKSGIKDIESGLMKVGLIPYPEDD